jgi:DNA polymerase III psi subunit
MSRSSCLVIVVLEDDHHKMLIYRYLKKSGLREHEIRIERSPSGEGSAENWVRKTFIKETNVYRNRHARTKLIVVIDADRYTVQERLQQLDRALRDSGKQPVDTAAEQIARLVPKRNVETWILCLNEHQVDEETDYKDRDDWSELIPRAAEALLQWPRSHDGPPLHCVDSLRIGLKELERLAG